MTRLNDHRKKEINAGFSISLLIGVLATVTAVSSVVGESIVASKKIEAANNMKSISEQTLINTNFTQKSTSHVY